MSKEDIGLDEDYLTEDVEEAEDSEEVAKTNLAKRRVIDNILEERRLSKQIAEFEFDLDC